MAWHTHIGGMLAHALGSKADHAYALLRIVSGLMFAFHGFQKIFGVLTDFQPAIGSQLWIGGIIEIVCGVAIALGVLTPWVALLASATMLVAYVQFHWKFDVGDNLFPTINKGELALLYATVFLFVACRGAGRWSVDGRRRRGGSVI